MSGPKSILTTAAVLVAMLPGLLVGCSGGQQGAAPTEPTAGSDPAKPWAPIFGAVVVGLLASGSVALAGTALTRFRRTEVTP